jgi:hypothetical protein
MPTTRAGGRNRRTNDRVACIWPRVRAGGARSGPRPVRPATIPRTEHAIIRASVRTERLEGPPIDIIFLVERLDSLIANGKKLPLTSNVVLDQNYALSLIDELRVAVPEEVRAAKRINSEGERIMDKAQVEADRIIARAQEQAAFLIDERGLTQTAEEEARRIIAKAEEVASEIRRGADEYAVTVLVGLEGDVVRTLQSIKKGIALLDERRAALRVDDSPEDENGAVPVMAVDRDGVEGASQPARL